MKNLLYILLFVPFLVFGQQVKIDTNTVSNIKIQQDLLLSSLDSHYKQYKLGAVMQIGGALLSSFVIASKTSDDDILSIPSAVVSMIGGFIVIDSNKWFSKMKTISRFSDKTTASTRDFDLKSYELNRSLGPINLKNVKSMFREGDSISVKTINGPVILNGILKTIAVNRIEMESNSRLFKFYLNQIEFIKR